MWLCLLWQSLYYPFAVEKPIHKGMALKKYDFYFFNSPLKIGVITILSNLYTAELIKMYQSLKLWLQNNNYKDKEAEMLLKELTSKLREA